jgi:serine/threonine protein kinase
MSGNVCHIYGLLHRLRQLVQSMAPNCVVAVKAFRQSGEKVNHDWKREVAALAKMNELGQKHIVRFITAFQRGKQEDLEHYVVFEWADGGNLRNLWDKYPIPDLSARRMNWWIRQLHGLSQALAAAHYMEDGHSYRHGDLKPANILWFPGTDDYGILKIGDWGEAKSHELVTALRHNTTAKFGTRRYEPPETGLQSSLPKEAKHTRSRLYDIWGIGCIALECIIWLLYGMDGLNTFNEADYGNYGYFYEVNEGTAKIHHVVTYWMDHMEKDALCRPRKTVLGDLLQVVRTGLLVVELPPGGGMEPQADVEQPYHAENAGPKINIIQAESTESDTALETKSEQEGRLRAPQLEALLHEILQNESETYWHRGSTPKPAPIVSERSPYLSAPPTSRTLMSNPAGLRAPEPDRTDYGQISLDPEDWTFSLDNDFAARLLHGREDAKISSSRQNSAPTRLCTQCQNFSDLLRDEISQVSYDTQTLQRSAIAKRCELCCLLWQTCEENLDQMPTAVQFQRHKSMLRLKGTKRAVLTLSQSYSKPML